MAAAGAAGCLGPPLLLAGVGCPAERCAGTAGIFQPGPRLCHHSRKVKHFLGEVLYFAMALGRLLPLPTATGVTWPLGVRRAAGSSRGAAPFLSHSRLRKKNNLLKSS